MKLKMYEVIKIGEEKIEELYKIEENYFNDFKAKDILPSRLSKTVSAFANASGGDIYLGIREENKTKVKHWEGFEHIEDANAHIQTLVSMAPLDNFLEFTFLQDVNTGLYVLQISVSKTKNITNASDGIPYVRHSASNLEVRTEADRKRLELDKGITSFENETVQETELEDIESSDVLSEFVKAVVPQRDNLSWIKKQHLYESGHLTVAGTLLFLDEPQIFLPKRSAIKIFRYKTSGQADRDMLEGLPLTVEGCAYQQIYTAVSKVKQIVESIKKLGTEFESVTYPEETLHEIITNAVLHRDYSIATDIQIRIFDNRIEVESPGKLPGHVTTQNILDTQSARNPKIVRLINKFPNAPNKDVGEGLNTAFDAMTKLRLKVPEIKETENAVLVIIKHEKLASPEELIVEYLKNHDSVKNAVGRSVTGIKSENTMKNVFYRLKKSGYIELIRGQNVWIKTEKFDELIKEQFSKERKQ